MTSSLSNTHSANSPSSLEFEQDTRHVSSHGTKIAPGEIAIGVIIGRTSENFDFFVFGIACVLVFPRVYFPFMDALEGTLASFWLFGIAFIARPIGTAVFMAIQRHYGRSVKLTSALFMLGVSTCGMAFVPGYNDIGIAAIVLLALFRLGQGAAIGGSWDGLASLLALNVPHSRRGWYAMIPQLGAPIGFIIASALFAFLYSNLSSVDFLSWGWRYPFYVAFAINVVALFARLRLVMTNEYQQLLDANELEPVPVVELLGSQWSNVVIGAFAALASYALFHLVTVFPLSWIVLYSKQSISEFLVIQMIGGVLAIFGIIASGAIADRVGRRTTLAALAVLIMVFSGFSAPLLDGGRVGQDVFMLVGFVLLGLSYGQAAGAVSANFAGRFRYTGAALTSDFAWLFGAGFAPVVALGLSAHFGLAYVSVYLLSGGACTLAALSINRALEIRDA